MAERTLFRIPTRVAHISEQFHRFSWHKDDTGNILYDQKSLGWFVLFEGSMEQLFVGHEKPSLNVGDVVFIDIVKP
jgi:hypothetical protein